MVKRRRLLAIAGIGVLVLVACGPAATPTPTPTLPPTPTRAAATATPTQAPGATVAPTPTAAPSPTPTKTSAAGPRYGGVLRGAIGIVPEGWDPFLHVNNLPEFANYIHDRLFTYNDQPPGCRITPWGAGVAESFRWLDDTTIQVKLRPGVKFQNLPPMNGRELTADDVVYTVTKQWPRIPLLAAVVRPNIKAVQAIDKQTVEIRLNKPYAPFPERLFVEKRSNIVGPEMYAGREQVTLPEQNVGLGPFIFDRWVTGVRFDVRRSENYWVAGRPYLDGVSIFIMPDLSSQAAALRSGKLDLLYIRSVAYSAQIEATAPQLEKKLCPFSATVLTYMRTDKAPFNDVRVRRALNMAIDREAMLKTVYLGQSNIGYSTITRALSDLFMEKRDYPSELQRYLEYNPTEAKRLLAEAGYPDGFDLTVTSESPVYAALHYGAEFLAVSFSKIGIRTKLQVLTTAEFLTKVYTERAYDQMAVGWGTPATTIDEATYDNFHSTSPTRNRSRIVDPVLDGIIDRLQVVTDLEKQKELVRQHQTRQVEMMWHLVLPQDTYNAFWWPYVKDVNFHGNTMSQADWVRHVWMEK